MFGFGTGLPVAAGTVSYFYEMSAPSPIPVSTWPLGIRLPKFDPTLGRLVYAALLFQSDTRSETRAIGTYPFTGGKTVTIDYAFTSVFDTYTLLDRDTTLVNSGTTPETPLGGGVGQVELSYIVLGGALQTDLQRIEELSRVIGHGEIVIPFSVTAMIRPRFTGGNAYLVNDANVIVSAEVIYGFNTEAVPVPASLSLLVAALASLLASRRRWL